MSNLQEKIQMEENNREELVSDESCNINTSNVKLDFVELIDKNKGNRDGRSYRNNSNYQRRESISLSKEFEKYKEVYENLLEDCVKNLVEGYKGDLGLRNNKKKTIELYNTLTKFISNDICVISAVEGTSKIGGNSKYPQCRTFYKFSTNSKYSKGEFNVLRPLLTELRSRIDEIIKDPIEYHLYAYKYNFGGKMFKIVFAYDNLLKNSMEAYYYCNQFGLLSSESNLPSELEFKEYIKRNKEFINKLLEINENRVDNRKQFKKPRPYVNRKNDGNYKNNNVTNDNVTNDNVTNDVENTNLIEGGNLMNEKTNNNSE